MVEITFCLTDKEKQTSLNYPKITISGFFLSGKQNFRISGDLGDDLGWSFYIWGHKGPETWCDFADYFDMDQEESDSDFHDKPGLFCWQVTKCSTRSIDPPPSGVWELWTQVLNYSNDSHHLLSAFCILPTCHMVLIILTTCDLVVTFFILQM